MSSVRKITDQDYKAVLEMAAEMHHEGDYADIPLSLEKCLVGLKKAVSDPDRNLCLIAENDRGAAGFFIGNITTYFFSFDRMAQDTCLFVRKDSRGSMAATEMLGMFYEWAKEQRVHEAVVATSTGVNTRRTERWLNSIGYKTLGTVTKRRVA